MFMFELEGTVSMQWLTRWTPDRVVRVQALASVIVLCSWAGHFTLTVPLSTQVPVYTCKLGQANSLGNPAVKRCNHACYIACKKNKQPIRALVIYMINILKVYKPL